MKKDSKICDKANSIIEKGFDSKPVYNNKYLKTEIKSYGDEITTNFPINCLKKSACCLSVIMTDSAFKMSINYYPQRILRDCK